MPDTLPRASLADTLAVLAAVAAPTLAKGVIKRRPRVVAAAAALGLDALAVRTLQRLRRRYGAGPVLLPLGVREQAVVLDSADMHRVLAETPHPFAAASTEKKAALAHFEPKGVLASDPADRAARRPFNEEALRPGCVLHPLAERFRAIVDAEAAAVPGRLDWPAFDTAWKRITRRIVLGDAAAADRAITDALDGLRRDANWAFLKPRRDALRHRFQAQVRGYVDRAEPGSLAALAGAMPQDGRTAPADQLPQWLFAFDGAGIATYRALAMLALHGEAAVRAVEEAEAGTDLPFLRACVLESVRLWPTTPMILRQSDTPTLWQGGALPAGAGLLIFVPYFHRDDERLPYAHRFVPDLWLAEPPAAFVPFSAGPAFCPARRLVPMLGSFLLAALLRRRAWRIEAPRRLVPSALPGTLDPFRLRLRGTARAPGD
jgi:cytochrome P450